jgi:polyribonucleotide nucleotidyltransferase
LSTIVKKVFQYGNNTVSIETGDLARQAHASALVNMDGTVVLATVVMAPEARPVEDFFPLTVHYVEKSYAAGKIPGGFFKREGKPSEREILISRLIDRPIRPLFPESFRREVQVIAMVLSLNPDVESDIVAMIATSAALKLANIPFEGPIGAARVGYMDGQFVLNPSPTQIEKSELDLVVAGNAKGVLMVESEAKFLPEKVMLEAVWFGHQQMQVVIQNINGLVAEAGRPHTEFKEPAEDAVLMNIVANAATEEITQAVQMTDKLQRNAAIETLSASVVRTLTEAEGNTYDPKQIKRLFDQLTRKIVRERILNGYPRIDGRDTRTVRPLNIRVGVLPRTHGSALFMRGETQALVVATLGVGRSAQLIENIMCDKKENFIFHYNFPPFCVCELGMMGSPKRREVGHGNLAKMGIQAVLPSMTEFPYVIRLVSEILGSNGSSSMASVCGSSLALMDAGVPIKEPVAGVAMGLIKESNKFAILTDILGDEDHYGDMDFKVAGTVNGITALQMDLKMDSITKFIMDKALEQAREGRLHILKHMNEIIDRPRPQVSPFAPTIRTMKINTEKIRDVIGKGGVTIRSIIEETGAQVDVNDDGVVSISAVDQQAGQLAWNRIEEIVADIEIGKMYEGKVMKITEFGAFVSLIPGKDGFLHISQITEERLDKIANKLQEGQMVTVKVINIDRAGRVRVSMKPSVLQSQSVI